MEKEIPEKNLETSEPVKKICPECGEKLFKNKCFKCGLEFEY